MIEKTLLAFWGVWLLLILIAAFRVFGFPAARKAQDRRWRKFSGVAKPVALIVPVKGFDLQASPRFFDAIFDQTYGDYRVIVCFESWEDPIAQWLCEHLDLSAHRRIWRHPDQGTGLRSITLVCGGPSQEEGQKVHNQRAAFAELDSRDTIVAFADADILCGKDWLSLLVAPINSGTHELSTTYRWLVPKRPTLANQFASVINASITTQGGAEWCTVLWGGSMAMTRGVFDELDVPGLLKGSVNDDLRISKAARKTGRKIAFVRSLILPTPIDFNWRGFFEFAKRQYTQVKFFSPILYTGVNFVLAFYVLGAVSIVAALVYGYFLAWVPVAAAYLIDQFRSLARQQIYLSLFSENGIRQKLFAASWLEHMLTPLWMLLHWLILVSTWTQSRITWAGVRYRILSKSKTKVLGRSDRSTSLPAGAPGLAMISALHGRPRAATSFVRPLPASRISSTSEKETPTPETPETDPPVTLASPERDGVEATLERISAALAVQVPEEALLAGAAAPPERTAPPASLPLAPGSAVLPLTAAFPRRFQRPAPLRHTRGPLTAVARALQKSRVLTPVSPREIAVSTAPISALTIKQKEGEGSLVTVPAAEAPAPAPVAAPSSFSGRRPLGTPERLREKSRVTPFPSQLKASPEPAPARPHTPKKSRPTPPLFTPRPLSPPPPPSPSLPSFPPSPVAPRPFPFSSSASRRSGLPAHARNGAVAKATPARSSRAQGASSASAPRPARPVARGASARP